MNTTLHPRILITAEMLSEGKRLEQTIHIARTIASEVADLVGVLGEFAFAQWFFGDWRQNNVGRNRGECDFDGIEVKCSATRFNVNRNLLVREDYAMKRKCPFYVQVILDTQSQGDIHEYTEAVICGWATYDEVDRAPKGDMGSVKLGQKMSGYKSHKIPVHQLHPMGVFTPIYAEWKRSGAIRWPIEASS
jgi:hypothetical protein